MKFQINEKYTLIFMISFLLLGFYTDIPFINYVWYLFFLKGIAGILLIVIWFQVCRKFSTRKIIEVMGVFFSGVIYLFFITFLQQYELKNNGIRTNGIIQNFEKSRRNKNYGSYQIEFFDKNNLKYKSNIYGGQGIYQKGNFVSVLYSKRIPEINQAD